MNRIESLGSYWEFDDHPDGPRYRRWPKHEAPRENPEWGDADAGPLQDFVWHPMVGWSIDVLNLTIELPDDGGLITAPMSILGPT